MRVSWRPCRGFKAAHSRSCVARQRVARPISCKTTADVAVSKLPRRLPKQLTYSWSSLKSAWSTGGLRLQAFEDYRVYHEKSGALVGIVVEAFYSDPDNHANALLRVRQVHEHALAGGIAGVEEHLIPLTAEIVVGVDASRSALLIRPPAGLLELGHEKLLLEFLRSNLAAYAQQPRNASASQLGIQCMPTKKLLMQAGRNDLVTAIRAAGGFLHVAQLLGWRAPRRPTGYWDNLSNVDQELTYFVAANWTEQTIPDSDDVYYYNLVTRKVRWTRPQPPQRVEADGGYMLLDDEADRVMPSKNSIEAAGRWDLHKAVLMHGGFQAVAAALDRPPSWPPRKRMSLRTLARELRRVVDLLQLPPDRLPTAAQLRDLDETEVLASIVDHGGFAAVAGKLGMRTARQPKHHWKDIAVVAAEMRRYMATRDGATAQQHTLPTHAELVKAGRTDLRYAVKLHGGSRVLAKYMALELQRPGAHNRAN